MSSRWSTVFLILAVVFLVLSVISFLTGAWADGAWALLIGLGQAFAYYQQHRSEQDWRWLNGPLGWVLTITYIVALGALTIMRLGNR